MITSGRPLAMRKEYPLYQQNSANRIPPNKARHHTAISAGSGINRPKTPEVLKNSTAKLSSTKLRRVGVGLAVVTGCEYTGRFWEESWMVNSLQMKEPHTVYDFEVVSVFTYQRIMVVRTFALCIKHNGFLFY